MEFEKLIKFDKNKFERYFENSAEFSDINKILSFNFE